MTAAARGRPLWRQRPVQALMLVTLLGFTSFFLTLAALPLWAVEGGVPEAAAGTATTVMLLTTVGTQLALPRVLARWGTTRTFVAGLLALGAPAPLLALSQDLSLLLPVSAVRGAGFAALTVLGSLLTTTVAPRQRRGEAVGLYGLAIAGPNLVAVPAGVAMTQHGLFGWVAALSAAPVLGVPAAVVLGRGHRPADSAPTTGEASRAVLRRVAAPCLVLLAATLAAGALVTFLPIALPAGSLALVSLLVLGLSSTYTRWRVGTLTDRMGLGLLLPGAVLTCTAGMLLIALGLGPAWDGLVLGGVLAFGAGYGVVLNLTLVAAFLLAGKAGATTASSVWNAAFDAGTAIGAAALGAVASAWLSLPGGFALAAALMLLTLPAAPRPRRHRGAGGAY